MNKKIKVTIIKPHAFIVEDNGELIISKGAIVKILGFVVYNDTVPRIEY